MTKIDFSTKLPLTIDLDELNAKGADEITLIDVRDYDSFSYGHIPGAINIPESDFLSSVYDKEKEMVLYCQSGVKSLPLAEKLRLLGYKAFSLENGYIGWLRVHIGDVNVDESVKKIEASINKKFHKELFTPFAKAIVNYELIKPNDKIAGCISGGKDSMLMAKLFQQLKRHNKFPFELVFLVMDPGYSKENRAVIERNAAVLGVPITIFESDIFNNVFNIEKSPCYICARMRRGHLYAKAKELGCNKIALGHHYDDVIETILMGILYGAQCRR